MRSRSAKVWAASAVLLAVAIGVWIWRAVANRPTYPVVNSPRPVAGKADAGIVVEEFSDFQCPACKAAQPVVKDMLQTFGDRIAFRYRHYPLLAVHPLAFRAAQAAECANDQGKFWEYHDKLFQVQPALSRGDLLSYAHDLGLNEASFTACLDSRAKADVVRDDMHEGDGRGVHATPTFFINSVAVPDWSKLKEAIQGKLIGG